MLSQHRLNFTQLDPEAANLDLPIGAAGKLDHAIGSVAAQIAGLVKAGIGWRVSGIGGLGPHLNPDTLGPDTSANGLGTNRSAVRPGRPR